MSTVLDGQLCVGDETTYGTVAASFDRSYEIASESLDYRPNRRMGQGLRVGSKVYRSPRRTTPSRDGGGDFLLAEVLGKGMGKMWRNVLGSATSALVSGTTYQQVATLADAMQAHSIQKGVPRTQADASSVVDPITFLGCVVPGFELSLDKSDALNLKVDVDAREVSTSQALATPTLIGANTGVYTFADATLYGSLTTAPTATALAVGATPLANVTGFGLTVNHNLNVERYFAGTGGRKGKPVAGRRDLTGKLDIVYNDQVFRDAFLSDSALALVATFTTPVALSTGFETLQIVLPEIRLNGELPKVTGEEPAMSCTFDSLDNLTAAQPIWIVSRTSDTAL